MIVRRPVFAALARSAAVGLAAVGMVPGAAAGIYKCTDASGAVYFSDISCPEETVKEVVAPVNPPPGGASAAHAPCAEDPYSPLEQVKRLEAERQGTRAATEKGAARRGLDGADRVELDRIEEELDRIHSREASLKEDLKSDSSIRRRWAAEELAELKHERTSLLRKRENLLAGAR